MKLGRNDRRKGVERARGRAAAWGAPAALAVALAFLPGARAQEHPPSPPAHPPAANAPGGHPPAATAPEGGALRPETGERHLGPGEHGPGGQHAPQGGEHEAGREHGAGEAGGEAHGEAQPAFSIHLPTWIYGPLKQWWYSGPATLSAAGAVDAAGRPVPAQELVGRRVEFVYEDHHAHPPREYPIRPTIQQVGSVTEAPPGAETATVTVDGRPVTLINPTVTFALEKMFPEGLVISLLTALGVALGALLLTRGLQRVPGRRQVVVEMIYEQLDGFTRGLIGPHYRRYLPLVGTLFIYILTMNLVGLIPGWMSPTANINVPAGLAIVIIAYVQFEGIRVNGLKGYLMHFVGEPWWLGPLNVPIHVIGELARVLSLTVRLFGNIFGEDVVIVILIGLAALFTKGFLPLQFPMYFLAIFTSFVQAMVFSILTCVYLALVTHHEDHGPGEDHGHLHETRAPAPAV